MSQPQHPTTEARVNDKKSHKGKFVLKLIDHFGIFICIFLATLFTFWLMEYSHSVMLSRREDPSLAYYLTKLFFPVAFVFFGACFALPVLRMRWGMAGNWSVNWPLCFGAVLPILLLTIIYYLTEVRILSPLLVLQHKDSFIGWLYENYWYYRDYTILLMMWLGYLIPLCFNKRN